MPAVLQHHGLQHRQVRVDVLRVRAIGKAGGDERAVERALLADADAMILAVRAVAARGGEDLLAHRIVDHRVLELPADLAGDRHRERREAVHEVRGAIERIDDPDGCRCRRCCAAFLGEDGVVGIQPRIVSMISASAARSTSVTKSLRPLDSTCRLSRRGMARTMMSPARRAA